jgi:hypothetical protein
LTAQKSRILFLSVCHRNKVEHDLPMKMLQEFEMGADKVSSYWQGKLCLNIFFTEVRGYFVY